MRYALTCALLAFSYVLSGCAKSPCKTTDAYWTNCLGEKKDEDGKYIGEWKNNLRHGYGAYDDGHGTKYTGHWVNDKKEGTGSMIYGGGHPVTYVGEWKDGYWHGQGTMTNIETGEIKSGRWEMGAFRGP